MDIVFSQGELTPAEAASISAGFAAHSQAQGAPPFEKALVNWLVPDAGGELQAGLTGDILWDWLYIDQLWVAAEKRGQGLGRQLMLLAESHAKEQGLVGIWLWTQSWQAEGFYRQLGYEVFARFPSSPRGHERIGLRKLLIESAV